MSSSLLGEGCVMSPGLSGDLIEPDDGSALVGIGPFLRACGLWCEFRRSGMADKIAKKG